MDRTRSAFIALLLALMAVTAGCTDGGDGDDDGEDGGEGSGGDEAAALELKGWIHASTQTVELKNKGDSLIVWDHYRVLCNDSVMSTGSNTTGPNGTAVFNYDGPALSIYVEYEVRVVEALNKTVVWSRVLPAGL